MKSIAILPAALLLTGCALSPEWRAQRDAKLAAQAKAIAEANAQADDATCRSYGAAPGSEPYVACRMNLANIRSNDAQVAAIIQQRQDEQASANAAALSGALLSNGR